MPRGGAAQPRSGSAFGGAGPAADHENYILAASRQRIKMAQKLVIVMPDGKCVLCRFLVRLKIITKIAGNEQGRLNICCGEGTDDGHGFNDEADRKSGAR
jgi:hypothetical protein